MRDGVGERVCGRLVQVQVFGVQMVAEDVESMIYEDMTSTAVVT
jgi:hypothetical protein